MDQATKRIGAFVLIIVIITMAFFFIFNNQFTEENIVSKIDNVGYHIDSTSSSSMNVTLQFSVVIENYGVVKEVDLPCENIESYLKVKNSTVPLVPGSENDFSMNSSYILDTTYTSTNCIGEPTSVKASENIIDEIVVTVPFRFVSGTYNFIWHHSFADIYYGAGITIDVDQQTVHTILEVSNSK